MSLILGLIVGLGIVAILIWMYIDTRKEFTSQHLQNTLKEMHKELLHLKDVRLSQKHPTREELEAMVPVLMHKLRIVDIGDWDNFIRSTARQMKRPLTQQTIKKGTWHYKVASVVSHIQTDLLNSKASTVNDRDLDAFVEWFDGQSWSLEALRSEDKQWTNLYDSIEPFMRDSKLRELIGYHIDISYVSCNSLLVERYTREWTNSLPIRILRQILLTGALSPRKVDSELSALLGDIDKRMNMLNRKREDKHIGKERINTSE